VFRRDFIRNHHPYRLQWMPESQQLKENVCSVAQNLVHSLACVLIHFLDLLSSEFAKVINLLLPPCTWNTDKPLDSWLPSESSGAFLPALFDQALGERTGMKFDIALNPMLNALAVRRMI
jgi:hypothetical protein